ISTDMAFGSSFTDFPAGGSSLSAGAPVQPPLRRMWRPAAGTGSEPRDAILPGGSGFDRLGCTAVRVPSPKFSRFFGTFLPRRTFNPNVSTDQINVFVEEVSG